MLLALAALAAAQDYRLPLADDDAQFGYPTAYKDHGGVDWGCGDIRYDGTLTDYGAAGFEAHPARGGGKHAE